MEHQHLYCHWDSHNENVLFDNILDLDNHLKSHYEAPSNQEDTVACHWDACHEMINLDQMDEHLKNFHFKDVQLPHDACSHGPHSEELAALGEPAYPYVWPTPPDTSTKLPLLPSPAPLPAQALEPCTCKWLDMDGVPCGREFSNSHDLNLHLDKDHIDRGCHCYTCRWQGCKRGCRPFVQRQKVVRHLQTHAKNWSFKCNICGHLSNDEISLRQHQRIHSGEKPHMCNVCGKRFTAMSSLTVHLRVHTGEKPLMCKFPGCGKRFAESSNLNKHMKTHLSRSIECSICLKKFTRKDQLQRHASVAHPMIQATADPMADPMGPPADPQSAHENSEQLPVKT